VGVIFGAIRAAAPLGFWWLDPATVHAPPFCLVVDWVAAAILVVLITVGVDFHH
jgi:hypothetical protein